MAYRAVKAGRNAFACMTYLGMMCTALFLDTNRLLDKQCRSAVTSIGSAKSTYSFNLAAINDPHIIAHSRGLIDVFT